MNKLLLTAIAGLTVAAGAWAAPVTPDRAKTTATLFMKQRTGRNVTVKNVVAQTDDYYLINLNPSGWVVVSADDVAIPVLGYNTDGQMSWSSVPAPMRAIMADFGREVTAAKAANRTYQNKEWKALTSGATTRSYVNSRSVDDGMPYYHIPVNWNQTAPFNKYCPGTGSNQAIVGCPAVSLSQAIAVQRYPQQVQGSVTYSCANYGQLSIDFDQEAPYDWDDIISGANRYDAAAKLLYHAGMAVHMNYGVDASGIPSNRVDRWVTALTTNFGYNSDDVKYYWRDNYRGDWKTLVLNEIEAGRAVIYNAIDRAGGYGHSFNVDGYDASTQFFHLNWGWGGYGNGYFSLDALRDSQMDMNYDSDHCVIIGIGSPDAVLRSLELSELVIDEKLAAGTTVGIITVNGDTPTSDMTVTIANPQGLPFQIKDNMLVTTQELTAQDKPYEVKLRVTVKGSNEVLSSVFPIQVVKLRTIAAATTMTYDRASGKITVRTRNNTAYTLTGKNGAVIKQGNLSPVPQVEFLLTDLDEGDNTLTISAGSESKTIKIKR